MKKFAKSAISISGLTRVTKLTEFEITDDNFSKARFSVLFFLLFALCSLLFALPLTSEGASADEDRACLVCHGKIGFGKDLGNGHVLPLYVDLSEIRGTIHKEQSCTDCHVEVTSIPHAEDLPPVNCEYCHYKDNLKGAPNVGQFKTYEDSVHGKLVEENDERAPQCRSCHGTHSIRAHTDPKSTIYKLNVPTVCANCHAEIYEKYVKGAHGSAIEQGIMDSAACNDCHGTHGITRPATTLYQAGIADTCARCHASETLIKKYGLPTEKVQTYEESFHGEANKFGSISAANCSSCHGAHDILPDSEPNSRINKANLPATCGKSGCHPNVTDMFAKGTFHVEFNQLRYDILGLTRIAYILLIVGVIGGMLVHDFLDFRARRAHRKAEGITENYPSDLQYEWLSLSERIQHIVLFVSFFILAITGFAVFIPGGWLKVFGLKSQAVMDVRGSIHRIAAVVMILDGIYHVFFHLFATKRGRWELRELLPRKKDLIDIIAAFKYYLGKSEEKPKFGRFSYKEKAEYLSLVWGTVVMTVTGSMLWIEEMWPKLALDISRIVHRYEAILAVLAIFVWHFYNVHWAPGKFPMDNSWLTGKISEEELMEEFPLEYERLQNLSDNP